MTVIATDSGNRFSNVVKHEYEPSLAYCREVVVVNEAAEASYAPGTVLGKVTASGKYKISKADATDGSEVAAAVVLAEGSLGESKEFTVAATTDTDVLVLVRGPAILSKDALILDATINTTPEKQAVYDALAALGIVLSPTI